MHASPVPSARTRIAIGISIAIHLCGLFLLELVLGQPPYSSTLVDEARSYPVMTIVRRTPTQTPMPRQSSTAIVVRPEPTPAFARPARVQVTARVPRTLPQAATRSPHVAQVPIVRLPLAPDTQASAPLGPPAVGGSNKAYGMLAVAPSATPTAAPTSAPTEAPTPERSPTSAPTATPANTFGGLFSQNYPPALPAPAIVAALRARLGGHGRIRIDVDESGHATDVHFAGLVDDAIARDVRAQLFGLTYVPADCNGLHCEGTLEISY